VCGVVKGVSCKDDTGYNTLVIKPFAVVARTDGSRVRSSCGCLIETPTRVLRRICRSWTQEDGFELRRRMFGARLIQLTDLTARYHSMISVCPQLVDQPDWRGRRPLDTICRTPSRAPAPVDTPLYDHACSARLTMSSFQADGHKRGSGISATRVNCIKMALREWVWSIVVNAHPSHVRSMPLLIVRKRVHRNGIRTDTQVAAPPATCGRAHTQHV
jgi:hypothetical protein